MGEPVKIPILGVGRFAGVEPGIFCGIFYRLGCGVACGAAWEGNILWNIRRLGWRLGSWGSACRLGSARIWRACEALVFNLWARRLRVVKQCRIFRWRVWPTSVSDQADFCSSEFVWMSSTRWNDQNLFWTTLKIRISPKTLLFF